jgi:hypothetical protein
MTGTRPAPPAVPGDHGWVDDGHGVLSCVAGDAHSPSQVVACPYYLRRDIAERLPGADLRQGPSLTWEGHPHYKIAQLAPPRSWSSLVQALPARHGVRPLRWSLFSSVQRSAIRGAVSPAAAYRTALHHGHDADHPVRRLLRQLADEAGDPGNVHGSLGLTGSAAIDPARLGAGNDTDLIIYPGAGAPLVLPALQRLGARFLPELVAVGDPRATTYLTTRLMPAITDEPSTRVLTRRRRDVAWLGQHRIDLTYAGSPTSPDASLPYDRPPVGRLHATATVTGIAPGFPVALKVESGQIDRLLITARGFQGVFRIGDRLRFTATLHRGDDDPFASLDDASGHRLSIEQEGQP